jgi:hypothetical protein
MSGERLVFRKSVLTPLCGLEPAPARHSLNEFNSALAYSQISVFRFQISVRLAGVSKVKTAKAGLKQK